MNINSFKYSKGCLIAIKGSSGSGKTKLLDAICGLTLSSDSIWELENSGEVVQITKENPEILLKEFISYLPQKTVLFEDCRGCKWPRWTLTEPSVCFKN